MEDRQETHPNQRALILTLSAAALETVFCAILLLRIPSDAKNAFLFGLSKERLLMTSAFAVLFVLCIILLIRRNWLYETILSKRSSFTTCIVLTLISLFLSLLPDYRFGKAAAYYTRVGPFLTWLFLVSFTFTLFCLYDRGCFRSVSGTLGKLNRDKKYILPFLATLLCGIAFVEITGLGKTVESSLWNKNGIPLQGIQLFLSAVIFALANHWGAFDFLGKRKRLLHFLFIWVISAAVWSLVPFSSHFFAPGPYDPDLAYYPYSDAASYDIAAQTALNGWGFNHGRIILKPTLVFISFLSHLVTGNDINRSMQVQSALFAVLPAVIYLFGSAIGGTSCGYLAAAFSILKEWNALNTHTVLTIHSRLVMSEFLTQILLAAFCYAVFRWLQRDGREVLFAILSGGMLTLGIFTRYNFLAFLPAALLILIIGYRKQLRSLLKPLLFFFLSLFLTAAPLIYRDATHSWSLLREFSYTVSEILIKRRLSNEIKNPDPSEIAAVIEAEENSVEISEADLISEDTDETANKNINEVITEASEAQNPAETPVPEEIPQNPPKTSEIVEIPKNGKEDFNTSQITQEFSNNNSIINLPVFPSMINHGLHNFIASALTLPMELSFDDLEHLYKQDGDGLWKDSWQGAFSIKQWCFIAVWVLLGAVTLGCLVRDYGTAGISIPYFWLVYCFSIGFSRSSGGRYVVPINWVPMLLLAFCIRMIEKRGEYAPSPAKTESLKKWKPVCTQAALVLFFTAMVLFENLMPQTDTTTAEGDLAFLQGKLSDVSIDWDLVKHQQEQGLMQVTHGKVVYPRFYYYLKGEHTRTDVQMEKDYSRMTFSGINKEGWRNLMQDYLLPHQELIHEFPHDSIFRAISCTSSYGYQDVLAMTVETPGGEIYTYVRDPFAEFSCPVPEPVCIERDNCR